MINKEIQVLNTIFELELKPPFEVEHDPIIKSMPDIYNRFWEKIGWAYSRNRQFSIGAQKNRLVFDRIKHTFNVEKISDEDVYYIAKHLFFWLQDKLPIEFDFIQFFNHDTNESIYYPGRH